MSQINCPKCGSNKVSRMPVVFIMMISGGCLVWVPVIGWVLGPIFMLIGVLMMFINKTVPMKCESCKNGFPIPKQQYKEWKSL